MVSSRGRHPVGEGLEPVDRRRLYEHVLEQLRQYVARERLGVGGRLPSERILAERLGVSRASVKQAIVVLEVQGLVETKHGGGSYLCSSSLATETIDDLMQRRERLPEVIEAREALEVKLAVLAAQRRTEGDLATMEAALQQMKEAVEHGVSADDGDLTFHRAMAEAGHSRLLLGFYRQLSPKIAELRRESLRQPGRPRHSIAEHQQILEAIGNGDASRAARAVRRHIQTVSKLPLLEWHLEWPEGPPS